MKSVVLVVISMFMFVGLAKAQTTTVTNAQLEALYKSAPDQAWGITSSNYSLTNYEGNQKIVLPAGKGLIFASDVASDSLAPKASPGMRLVKTDQLGETVRVCYRNKPFFQLEAKHFGQKASVRFTLHEQTIDKNSFAFIHGYFDFQGEVGGLYINGKIISQYIMVKGGVPFVPMSVKKVDQKIIVNFESANEAALYALYNETTGQLTLPADYEAIQNDYTTASKKLK